VTAKKLSGSEAENQNGFLFWNFELTPGQTKALQFGYQIEYPRGRQINLR
jgi:hypothetical protein